MDAVERIISMCKSRGIPISRLEKDCGFANGYIRKLKEGKIPADRLFVVADYFKTSPEYLLTGINPERESSSGQKYYFDDDTAKKAQDLSENPALRNLFNIAIDSRPEDLQMATDLLVRLKAYSQLISKMEGDK